MSPAPIPDQERQHAVACRKFFLIGIATIVIYAVFYAFLKSYSDSETSETEIRVQSSAFRVQRASASSEQSLWLETFITVIRLSD